MIRIFKVWFNKNLGLAIFFGQVLSIVGFLGMWQLLSDNFIDKFWISSPYDIFSTLVSWVSSGDFWFHLKITLYEIIVGFILGGAFGVALGFFLGHYELLGKIFDPILVASYGIPRSALAPLFILWFGIGLKSKIAQAAVMVFFVAFFNTFAGVKSVDIDFINVAKVLGANEKQIVKKIKFPAAFPFIITGLKVGLPMALIGAVVAEFISSNKGIGYLIMRSTGMFDTAGTFAGIFTLLVVVMIFNSVLNMFEKHILRWRPKGGPAGGE